MYTRLSSFDGGVGIRYAPTVSHENLVETAPILSSTGRVISPEDGFLENWVRQPECKSAGETRMDLILCLVLVVLDHEFHRSKNAGGLIEEHYS